MTRLNNSFPPVLRSEAATPYGRVPRNPARELAASAPVRLLAFLALHMLLALALEQSGLLATLHALGAFALAFYFLVYDRQPHRLIYVTAYIAGAELLWRGTGASVFWEFAKYSISLLLILSLVKEERLRSSAKLPLLYFILLLPSLLVLTVFDREEIAFNLSGPFALAIAAMYFDGLELSPTHLRRILLAVLGPIAGLAFLAAFQIATADSIAFVAGGKATAAGIGPNQVSSILGLGIVAAFFLALLEKKSRFIKTSLFVTTIWLVAQTALTLSRGGLWTALCAIAAATWFLLRDRRSRTTFLLGGSVAFLIVYFFALPWLDNFSGGALLNRLEDTDLTGRDRIIQADLLAFQEYPLLGLGPGGSTAYHAVTFREASAHTEYSRLLAEHGSMGLLALLVLLGLSLRPVLTNRLSPLSKAFVVACTVWALLFMFHAAMRLVAPAYLFGLAGVSVLSKTQAEGDDALL